MITPDNPAKKGSTVQLFITGLGALRGVVGTNKLAPVPALMTVEDPAVGIDHAGMEDFGGFYAPFLIGVYQVNFKVAENVESGKRDLNVVAGGISSPRKSAASRVALAAHRQAPEKYEALHVALMSSPLRMNATNALGIAGDLGYDVDRLRDDLDSPEISRSLGHNNALAEQLGIRGTPGFVIGDQIIGGAIDMDTLLELIAQARQS